MTSRCVLCGMIDDCGWIENPTKDYTCDLRNIPHRWKKLHWVRNMPGDRKKATRADHERA